MSNAYNGNDMNQSYNSPGSVRRAREQAQEMLHREGQSERAPPSMTAQQTEMAPRSQPLQFFEPEPQPNPMRSRAPPNYEARPGQTISKPTRVPQWPLPGSSSSFAAHGESGSQSRPQARPQQVPVRPPRPSQSRIPSILDPSRPQHPTPVFIARPMAPDYYPEDSSIDSYDESSPPGSSAPHTTSSVATAPDVSVPATASMSAALRKNAALGLPPSSRRGASSFYSNAPFVPPIMEEVPRMKPQGFNPSGAAVPPQSWRGISPQAYSSNYGETFYEESMTEQSRESTYDDYGDESQLVRSASLGKKGKPALIDTKSSIQERLEANEGAQAPPSQTTMDADPYLGAGTSSSETIPMSSNLKRPQAETANGEAISPDAILKAFASASSPDVRESIPLAEASRQRSRMSAMRRPPRLDIDAVRAAEARGSLTSLPDLIRRATRLAAMIDKGKRPASRLDALDGFLNEKEDGHRSGLSDMLAAFPPPVHTPRNNTASRNSWFRGGWPLGQGQDRQTHSRSPSGQDVAKPRRRCCGLPIWVFVLIVFLTLCLIAAAVVIPLEFFVFKNLGNNGRQQAPSLGQCQKKLTCENGGTNIVVQGSCFCICTNSFTGPTCGEGGATGCAMTELVSTDGQSSIQNVTLGGAIPRLLADANQNYSVPLSGASILARLDEGNVSCMAQNSLVTFDGRNTRSGQATDEVEDVGEKHARLLFHARQPPSMSPETSRLASGTNMKVPAGLENPEKRTGATSPGSSQTEAALPTTLVVDTGSSTKKPSDHAPSTFEVTEERVDFARVAVLYIVQEGSVDKAMSAQGELQKLFSKATKGKKQQGAKMPLIEATNVDLGSGYSINMVDLTINIGKGPVGREKIKNEPTPGTGG